MAPQETSKLDTILEQLGEHRADFRAFSTEMVGGVNGLEKPTGRIPVLESTSRDHGKRITRLERFALIVIGAVLLLRVLAWGAASISQVIQAFKS